MVYTLVEGTIHIELVPYALPAPHVCCTLGALWCTPLYRCHTEYVSSALLCTAYSYYVDAALLISCGGYMLFSEPQCPVVRMQYRPPACFR